MEKVFRGVMGHIKATDRSDAASKSHRMRTKKYLLNLAVTLIRAVLVQWRRW